MFHIRCQQVSARCCLQCLFSTSPLCQDLFLSLNAKLRSTCLRSMENKANLNPSWEEAGGSKKVAKTVTVTQPILASLDPDQRLRH